MRYLFFLMALITLPVHSAEKTFVKEYIYQASILDNQITCRTISLREVKREILEELGTYVFSKITGSSNSDGTETSNHEFEVITAGITKVKILNEDWNGKRYKLKAELKVDPDEVYKNINDIKRNNRVLVEQIKQNYEEVRLAKLELEKIKEEINTLRGVEIPTDKQKKYFSSVKTLIYAEMQEEVHQYYLNGDFEKAIELTNKLINKGYLKANTLLGYFYASGKGVNVNKNKAYKYYQLGFPGLLADAEKGNLFSQNMVGMAYMRSRGVRRDYKEAMKWFKKSASSGHAASESNIGYMYLKGFGLDKNYHIAEQWFEKAAEKKYRRAVFWLGRIYEKGLTGEKNIDIAIEYYKEAAKLNDTTSISKLGYYYETGIGLEKNIQTAMQLYLKGIELGGRNSMYRLGLLYEKGVGVESNMEKAIELYEKAAKRGLKSAKKRLMLIQ